VSALSRPDRPAAPGPARWDDTVSAEFVATWERVCPHGVTGDPDGARKAFRSGVTPEDLRTARMIAEDACSWSSPLAGLLEMGVNGGDVGLVTEQVVADAREWAHMSRLLPATVALRWLAVAAGRDQATGEAVRRLVCGTVQGGAQVLTELRRWRGDLPDAVAPLAWAAGLQPEEAARQWRAGALREDVLLGLAALRGYRLAPVAMFAAPQETPGGTRGTIYAPHPDTPGLGADLP
jgi:hypothetical protein